MHTGNEYTFVSNRGSKRHKSKWKDHHKTNKLLQFNAVNPRIMSVSLGRHCQHVIKCGRQRCKPGARLTSEAISGLARRARHLWAGRRTTCCQPPVAAAASSSVAVTALSSHSLNTAIYRDELLIRWMDEPSIICEPLGLSCLDICQSFVFYSERITDCCEVLANKRCCLRKILE